jgi:hypothetical protein
MEMLCPVSSSALPVQITPNIGQILQIDIIFICNNTEIRVWRTFEVQTLENTGIL